MKKVAICAAAMAVASTSAWAGYKSNYPVSINLTTRTAQGYVGSARNSPDTLEYIACNAIYDVSWTGLEVTCSAEDQAGHVLSCVTANQSFAAALGAVSANAWISFTADASGVCTHLAIGIGSMAPPVQP